MSRSLLALVLAAALLLPQGFTRVALFVCAGSGEIHAEACCEMGDCCHEWAAGDHRDVARAAPADVPAPMIAAEPVSVPLVVTASPSRLPDPWRTAPATGPPDRPPPDRSAPVWLQVRALRL